jgi:hypothetical protein
MDSKLIHPVYVTLFFPAHDLMYGQIDMGLLFTLTMKNTAAVLSRNPFIFKKNVIGNNHCG